MLSDAFARKMLTVTFVRLIIRHLIFGTCMIRQAAIIRRRIRRFVNEKRLKN